MAVSLPYHFDTSVVVRLILRGVLLLLLVLVAGVVYSIVISRDQLAATALLLSGLILLYFGRLFRNHLIATRGTITKYDVVVEPADLYGIRLYGPSGRFPLTSFAGVRVERVSDLAWAQGGPHERVTLTGKPGTPDILVARTSKDAGRNQGRALAETLGLTYMEEIAPY
jgi:hypothetical protein